MSNLTNQKGYVTNPAFSGGEPVTPMTGSQFAQTNKGYGGLYVGTKGDLVIKTIDGSILTLVSASGFINGLVAAVSASSTATNIVGFDPIVSSVYVPAAPTTTTAAPTTTTTVAP
jgi:hypothetical protein